MNQAKLLVSIVVCAGLGVSAVGCGYSEEEMQMQRDRVDQLTKTVDQQDKENKDLKGRVDALTAENKDLNDRLRQMGVNVEGSKKSNAELNKQLEELRAKERQAQARLATFRSMLEKFRAMIASGKLRVRIERGRMVVELSENILFDSGKSDLKKEGQAALIEVAGVLTSITDREFQIAGHTDNVPIKSGKFPSNWELSTARALTVAHFLASKSVPENRLSAAGYAESQPVASNDTPEGRAQNRRIEIVLMPNLDELPDLSSLENEKSK